MAVALALTCAGTAGAAAGEAPPVRQGNLFVYSDGTRVRATDPNGRAGIVQSNGTIRYVDGTVVTHDTRSGETRIDRADGRSETSSGDGPRRDGDTFQFSDGVRVRAVDPSGRAGVIQSDGSIRYPDGTIVSHDSRTGDTKYVHGDGRVEVLPGGGPQRGEDGNFQFPDGTRLRGTDPSGNPGTINSDGSVSYADGTRVTHDNRGGDTKFVSPDGSVRLVNTRTGTDKTFPAGTDGKKPGGSQGGQGGDQNDGKAPAANNQSDQPRQPAGGKPQTEKPQGEKPQGEKPQGEKPVKEKVDKTRMVQDQQSTGRGPRLVVGGIDRTQSPDESTAGSKPKLTKPGVAVGPGARPGNGVAPAGPASTLPVPSLVVNPNPVDAPGKGKPTPIDASGGRR